MSARIVQRAERFFGATGATLAHGGNRAFYRPSTDSIVLPRFETFRDAESYYATLAHETIHATAHQSRLARDFGSKRFGSEGYAIEELVAELGASFLCADLDLTLEPREDHAVYIANWLDVLKSDKRAIFARGQPRAAGGGLHQRPAAGLRRLHAFVVVSQSFAKRYLGDRPVSLYGSQCLLVKDGPMRTSPASSATCGRRT